jgi:hypothetical protein
MSMFRARRIARAPDRKQGSGHDETHLCSQRMRHGENRAGEAALQKR